MRIQLGELAARGFHVERPGTRPEVGLERIQLASAEALTGELTLGGGELLAREVACTRLALSEVVWSFGAVVLRAVSGGELTDLSASARSAGGSVSIDLRTRTLLARPLAIALPSLSIEAEVEGQGVSLHVHDMDGYIACEQAVFRGFLLRSHGFELSAPELVVHNLRVGWGARFQLAADTASIARVAVGREGATFTLEGLALAALSLDGPRLTLGQLRVERVQGSADLLAVRTTATNGAATASGAERGKVSEVRASDAASPAPSRNKTPLSALLEPSLLDGLSGRIDADVHVDLTVPVLGRRRAKHELRLAVDAGAIDYRALEHGLATLEDSLLDFSVRDGALVLERGLPLIRTRGRGKPILKWELGPEDLALAEQQRVRLLVLPRFQPVRTRDASEPAEAEQESESSSFALRELAVLNLDLALALLQTAVAPSNIRELTFANLTLRGELRHDADGAEPGGQLDLGLATLRVLVEALPLGASEVRGQLELASLSDGRVSFADLRPRALSATLDGLAVAGLEVKPHRV